MGLVLEARLMMFMAIDDELEGLRRALQSDPKNRELFERYRAALDRVHGKRPTCPRCRLSTHMAPGRLDTAKFSNWIEPSGEDSVRAMGYRERLHLVGWRCRICNIITVTTVPQRDDSFDWLFQEEAGLEKNPPPERG